MTIRDRLYAASIIALAAFYAATAWFALHPHVSVAYRDHFIRQATHDWNPRHSNESLADGMNLIQPTYPREVDYVLGLGGIEPLGRWSDARRWPTISVLLHQPVVGTQCLELGFDAASWQVMQPVFVRMGDAGRTLLPGDGQMHHYEMTLTVTAPASSIDIEPSRPARPLGWGDVRRLAIRLAWIRLRPGHCGAT